MEKSKPNNRRLFKAVAWMLFIGLLSSQGFLETSLFIKTHLIIKYSIYFIWLILIGAIGVWGWNEFPQQWVLKIWKLSYLFVIMLLLILGLLDLFLGPIPLYYKKDISQFRSFFLSPALFVLLYLLSVFVKNKESPNN